MVFQNKLVAAVKVNGQVLRESGDVVVLPFGSEYSILIKNLDSVRQQVDVSVDGKIAAERIVIAPNSSLELERFIRDGNLESGNRFKFIERSAAVEVHRGVKEDDGIVRVEAWREKVAQVVDEWLFRKHYINEYYPVPRPYYQPMRPWWDRRPGIPMRSMSMRPQASAARRPMHPTRSGPSRPMSRPSANNMSASFNDAGITVAGSQSNQRFHLVSGFTLHDVSTVMVLHLRGMLAGKPVSAPVTVKAKSACETCGKSNKANSKFCAQCGTSLVLL